MRRKGGSRSNDLRPEYVFDYSKAVRGKYYRRLIREGANIAVLEPDVAAAFRDSAAVNDALRSLLQVSETTRRLTGRPTRPRPRRRSGVDATADAGRGICK
ncbi:MAG: hypothetical protein ABSA52_17695 [Candidatus Binatia bacterium]|jgi:hypothetical protein